jgi:Tol biopolymer transport system component
MKKGFLILILSLIVKFSFGQQFTDLHGDYLGQTPPGDTPVVFARGIVSTEYQNHGAPSFSPDGNQVFWQENRRPGSDSEKWISHSKTMWRIGDKWTVPEVSQYGNMPFFSPDGKRIYFANNENNPCFVEKQGNNWSEPKVVDIVTRFPELKFAYCPSITHNGTLYFVGYSAGPRDNYGNNYGIYRAELINGEYAKPELLPPSVNKPGILNWTPFIATDESYLIFSSNRGTSNDDPGDIYISFRQLDGHWTDADNLGATINSNQQERFPAVSPDGKYLFFTRWTSDYDEDVFWVSAKIIDRLREKSKTKK